MARTHVVLAGETLESMAAAEGLHDFRKRYDSPDNAALRRKRPPLALLAGDEVVLPDLWARRGGALRKGTFVGDLPFCLEGSGF